MYFTLGLIVAYIIIVKVIAFFAYRGSKETIEDYYLASRGLGGLLLFGTLIATKVNGMVVTATPAQVVEGGILYTQFYIALGISLALLYFMGPKVMDLGKKYNAMTHGELLGKYYQSSTLKYFGTLIAILSLFPFLAVQMIAVGKVFSESTNGAVSYEFAVILLALSVAIYLIYGGSRAVVWTDLFQAIVFMVILIVSAVLFSKWAGGFGTALDKLYEVTPEKMSFTRYNVPPYLDRLCSWSFAFFFWPHIFQRCFMTNSGKRLKVVTLFNLLSAFIILTLCLIIGVSAAAALHGQITDHDKIMAQMYTTYLPLGAAFIVLTVFASGMSTIDSMLLSLSSILSRDTVRHNKELSEKQKFNFARIVSLLSVVLISIFVLSDFGRGAIAPLTTVGASFATLFLWPFIGMFYWKQANKYSAFWSMFLGFAAIIVTQFTSLGESLPIGSATVGFLVGLITFVSMTVLAHSLSNSAALSSNS